MIVGNGVDIVAVARVRRSLERFGDRFAKKILNPAEMLVYARATDKAGYLAKRFAAKEAASKALGTGMREGIHFRQIGVVREASGAPRLTLEGAAARRAAVLGVNGHHVSLADEKEFAIAMVILES